MKMIISESDREMKDEKIVADEKADENCGRYIENLQGFITY